MTNETKINTRAVFGNLSVRKLEGEDRAFEFVAATEGGVETWMGREFLDMDGIDMSRYESNPVLLDSHNRDEATAVIGKAALTVEGRQLIARAEFATTDRAEEVFKLVDGGFINALSVGFLPRNIEDIDDQGEGELDGREIKGPARIIRKWELYEISVVPVPADAEAVRRTLESSLIIFEKGSNMTENETVEDEAVTEDEVTPVEEVADEPEAEEEEVAEDTPDADKEEIMAIGRAVGLESDAKFLVVAGASLEDARAALTEKLKAVDNAVNTVEPVPVTEQKETKPLSKRDFTG